MVLGAVNVSQNYAILKSVSGGWPDTDVYATDILLYMCWTSLL